MSVLYCCSLLAAALLRLLQAAQLQLLAHWLLQHLSHHRATLLQPVQHLLLVGSRAGVV